LRRLFAKTGHFEWYRDFSPFAPELQKFILFDIRSSVWQRLSKSVKVDTFVAMAAAPKPITEQRKEYLDSWKEIAVFLNRGVRTVQRWEREENLPVHRHNHKKRGTVSALASEIMVWLSNRDNGSKTNQAIEIAPSVQTENGICRIVLEKLRP
jgi:hypothetical protein